MVVNDSNHKMALIQAIENLYLTFAEYPLPKWTDPCMHYHDKDEELLLHNKPLRDLGPDDLETYVWDALLTWGSEDTFKHFLPRIFELTVEYEWTINPEIIIDKLHHGDWHKWPEEEQESVSAYLMAVWQMILSEESFEISVEEWLCAVGQAVDDLAPFLDSWYQNAGLPSRHKLAEFIFNSFNTLGIRRKFVSEYWSDRHEQAEQVISWLIQPASSVILEQAFYEYSSEPEAEEISWAVDQLAILRDRFNSMH